MFNIGPGELIVILIVALVFLGPEKLPEMAKTVGKGMRELRRATEDLKDQVETEFYEMDKDKPRSPILQAPPGPRVAKTEPAPAAPAVTELPAVVNEVPAAAPPEASRSPASEQKQEPKQS